MSKIIAINETQTTAVAKVSGVDKKIKIKAVEHKEGGCDNCIFYENYSCTIKPTEPSYCTPTRTDKKSVIWVDDRGEENEVLTNKTNIKMEIKPKYNIDDTAIVSNEDEYRIGKIIGIFIQGGKIYYRLEMIAGQYLEEEISLYQPNVAVEQMPEQIKNRVKPTLDDYTTIKTYEDACEALGEEPILNKIQETTFHSEDSNIRMILSKSVIALKKLETIARALRGGRKIDFTKQDWWYYPYFYLYTDKVIAEMREEVKQEVNLIKIDASRVYAVGGSASDGTYCGLGCVDAYSVPFEYYVLCNSQLCFLQRTEEVAKYYGKQFIELWAEYNDLDVVEECKELI